MGVLYQLIVQDFIVFFEIKERVTWLQQDGMPVHTAGSTLNMLQELF